MATDPVTDFVTQITAGLSPQEKKELPSAFAGLSSAMSDAQKGVSPMQMMEGYYTNRTSEIAKQKAQFAQQIATNTPLTRTQTVALTFLTALPILIGGIAKGKRGAYKGAQAAMLGTQGFFAAQKEDKDKKDKLAQASIEALDAEQKAINTSRMNLAEGMATEDMKQKNRINLLDEKRARGMGEGTTVNNIMPGALVKGELPAAVQQEVMKLEGATQIGEQIASKLEGLPSDLSGTITNQISKRFTATERGKIESGLQMYQRMLQSAIEGKRGSDQDNAIFRQIVSGDFTASPQDQARLIRQANAAIKRIALGEIETFQQLGTAEGVEAFKGNLRKGIEAGETIGNPVLPPVGSIVQRDGKDYLFDGTGLRPIED